MCNEPELILNTWHPAIKQLPTQVSMDRDMTQLNPMAETALIVVCLHAN